MAKPIGLEYVNRKLIKANQRFKSLLFCVANSSGVVQAGAGVKRKLINMCVYKFGPVTIKIGQRARQQAQ